MISEIYQIAPEVYLLCLFDNGRENWLSPGFTHRYWMIYGELIPTRANVPDGAKRIGSYITPKESEGQ